jgi:hypothetical protein
MRKLFFLVFVVASFFLFSVAQADFAPRDWPLRARIAGSSTSKYVSFQLSSEFFSRLKADLSDLRVINSDGEVPYVLGVERESQVTNKVPARFYNLSSRAGESTSFVVDLGARGLFHNAITIQTSSKNFRRTVLIEGSDDEKLWRILTSNGQVFDYTVRDVKSVSVSDTEVRYPDATFRYLRVTIQDAGESPLKVGGVDVYRQVSLAAREATYNPDSEVSQNAKARTTDIVVDLGAGGIPHRRGVLKTATQNFSRPIALYDSTDKNDWRLLTYGYVYQIATERFTGSHLDFAYPESNRRYLKIAILNEDDQPIEVGGVTLYGVVRRILFDYSPGKDYFVYIGNANARRPQYDFEKISQYIDTNSLDEVGAGPIESNPDYIKPEEPKVPITERSPYILPVLLGFVVAVFAFLLLRLVGGKAKPPPSSPITN